MNSNYNLAKSILASGKIGVIPTDTIYGLVGKAMNEATVNRIYKTKERNPQKPFIVLISDISDLKLFDIKINQKTKGILEKVWPGKVSVILSCLSDKFSSLHRNTKTLAFRLPDKKDLLQLIKETGPLVAPSANPEGLKPAKTIAEAKKYFGRDVDFYIDEGRLDSLSSTLIEIRDGKVEILREGLAKINNLL
jgi:L-threonylcarbamoyladenylate synthase